MIQSWLRRLSMLGLTLCVIACGAPAQTPARLTILVTDQDQTPVPGAEVSLNGQARGVSDAAGQVSIQLPNAEGTSVKVALSCPVGFKDQTGPVSFALRHSSSLDGSRNSPAQRQRVICEPTERSLVLVVNAPNEAGIPVLVDGAPRAVTNSTSIAHLLLQGEPGTSHQMMLDTSLRPELRPQNPSRSFSIGTEDEILTFDQQFKTERRRAPRRKSSPAALPYKIE